MIKFLFLYVVGVKWKEQGHTLSCSRCCNKAVGLTDGGCTNQIPSELTGLILCDQAEGAVWQDKGPMGFLRVRN